MLLSPLLVQASFLGCHQADFLHDCTGLSKSFLRKNKDNPAIFTFDRVANALNRKFGDVEIEEGTRQGRCVMEEWCQQFVPSEDLRMPESDWHEFAWHLWLEHYEWNHRATAYDYKLMRMAVGGLRTLRHLFITESTTREEALAAVREMVWPTLALSEDTLAAFLADKKQDLSALDKLSLFLFSLAACDMAAVRRYRLPGPIMPGLLPERRERGKKQGLALPTARWLENTGKLLVAQGTLKHGGFRTLAGYLGVSENSLRMCRSGKQLPPYGGTVWGAIAALGQKGIISRECTETVLGHLQFANLMTAPWRDFIRRGHTEDELLSVYARIPAYHRFLGQLAEVPGEAVTSSSPGFPC
ncbi:hypothetical protein DA2_3937 [Desulfovibrio sp. A2]|nr:hypothetical protein DA2_3937 [Desulfovibrio sp. A2]